MAKKSFINFNDKKMAFIVLKLKKNALKIILSINIVKIVTFTQIMLFVGLKKLVAYVCVGL